jgi:hypothetical protein
MAESFINMKVLDMTLNYLGSFQIIYSQKKDKAIHKRTAKKK